MGRGENLRQSLASKSVEVSNKYAPNDGLSSKKSMLIDYVINAVHEYIDLLDNSKTLVL